MGRPGVGAVAVTVLIRPGDVVDPWVHVRRHVDPVVELGRPYLVVDQVVLTEHPDALWEVEEPYGVVARLLDLGDGRLEVTRWWRQREVGRTVGRPEELL
ncbi:MAG: hypothetical protein ACXV3F_15030 [Frankiaceae bacterium]